MLYKLELYHKYISKGFDNAYLKSIFNFIYMLMYKDYFRSHQVIQGEILIFLS